MQLLFGDFAMPCKCSENSESGGARASIVVDRIKGTCQVGVTCVDCNAQVLVDFNTVDTLFSLWASILETGSPRLGSRGLHGRRNEQVEARQTTS